MDEQLQIIWARFYFGIPVIRLSINKSLTDHAMRYVVVNFSKMLERNLSNRKIFCSVYLQRRYVPNLDYSTIISFRIHDFNFCTGDQCPLSLVVFFTRRKILISVVFLPCPVLNNDVSNQVNGIHYAINTYNTCSIRLTLFTLPVLQTYIEDRHNIEFNQFSDTCYCFNRLANIQNEW